MQCFADPVAIANLQLCVLEIESDYWLEILFERLYVVVLLPYYTTAFLLIDQIWIYDMAV